MNTTLLAAQAQANIDEAFSLFNTAVTDDDFEDARAHWYVALYIHHVCDCRPPGNPPPGSNWPPDWGSIPVGSGS